MSISPQSGAKGSNDCRLLKYYNIQKLEVNSLWGWTLPKIHITSKNISNEESYARGVF